MRTTPIRPIPEAPDHAKRVADAFHENEFEAEQEQGATTFAETTALAEKERLLPDLTRLRPRAASAARVSGRGNTL